MSEFKKIQLPIEEYNKLLEDVVETFYSESNSGYGEDINVALRKHVFNIFDPDDWNSCECVPPKEYHGKALLIGRKDLVVDENGRTGCTAGYTIGYYEGTLHRFYLHDDDLNVNEHPEMYEYKPIKKNKREW